MLIFLYIMWLKRDVWVHRLLTSNTRLRYFTVAKNEQIPSKDSIPDSSHQEDIIENAEEKDDDVENNNEGINSKINDKSTASTKSSSAQKINIRVRRNKISFNKERQKK